MNALSQKAKEMEMDEEDDNEASDILAAAGLTVPQANEMFQKELLRMVNNGAIKFDKLDDLPPQELQEEIQRMKEAGSCEYLEDLCDESSIFTYKPPN